MNLFIRKHALKIIGTLVGLLGGYLYYRLIGCNSGTCPITSNPWISTVYGGLIGFLLFDLFNKKEKKNVEE
jgi:LytS/YehU family sensor histidine kinase